MSNAHNGALLGTVSAYRDSFLGQLTRIGSSSYADGQTAARWVEISHDGKYLFTVNTSSGTISSYSINPDGSLTLIGSTAITGGGADTDALLSPDGNYLLVDGSRMHFVSVFVVSGGNLTEVPSSPTPLPRRHLVRRDRQHLACTRRRTGPSRAPPVLSAGLDLLPDVAGGIKPVLTGWVTPRAWRRRIHAEGAIGRQGAPCIAAGPASRPTGTRARLEGRPGGACSPVRRLGVAAAY